MCNDHCSVYKTCVVFYYYLLISVYTSVFLTYLTVHEILFRMQYKVKTSRRALWNTLHVLECIIIVTYNFETWFYLDLRCSHSTLDISVMRDGRWAVTVCLFVNPSICRYIICMYRCKPASLSVCLYIICLCINTAVRLPFCLSVCASYICLYFFIV